MSSLRKKIESLKMQIDSCEKKLEELSSLAHPVNMRDFREYKSMLQKRKAKLMSQLNGEKNERT